MIDKIIIVLGYLLVLLLIFLIWKIKSISAGLNNLSISGGNPLTVKSKSTTPGITAIGVSILTSIVYIFIITQTFGLETKQLSYSVKVGGDDVIAGSTKACLFLANSTNCMDLQFAKNGVIANQGHTQIIKSDSQLLYKDSANSYEKEVFYNTLTTPEGGKYELRLSDGTNVWLNAASSITFPPSFTDSVRKVEITGEAFFEVSNTDERPFIVKIIVDSVIKNSIQLKVVGTRFNISAYKNDSAITITVLEGQILIQRIGLNDQSFTIIQGEQTSIKPNNELNVLPNADTAKVSAWKSGYFQFKNDNIQTVIRQLVRWYDLEVEFKGPISGDKYSGRISRTMSLIGLLKALNYAGAGTQFIIEDRKLIITPGNEDSSHNKSPN